MSKSNGNSKKPDAEIISNGPLPSSRKVYVSRRRVAMREIAVTPTRDGFSQNGHRQENPPLMVYDTSGPYTDAQTKIELRKGLGALRSDWIESRGDTEEIRGQYLPKASNGTEHFPDDSRRPVVRAK